MKHYKFLQAKLTISTECHHEPCVVLTKHGRNSDLSSEALAKEDPVNKMEKTLNLDSYALKERSE